VGEGVEADQKETGFQVHRWDLCERALLINATTMLVAVTNAHAWPSSNTYASPLLLEIHTIQFKYVLVCLREIRTIHFMIHLVVHFVLYTFCKQYLMTYLFTY
jgi:hypothetical protein